MHYILRPKKSPSDGLFLSSIPPLFFAGPVRGGDDWQSIAFSRLRHLLPSFCAVIPIPDDAERLGMLSYGKNHLLARHFIGLDHGDFDRQLNWERHFMRYAALHGCLIFWLPAESTTNPRPEGYFGRDTMGELGEWRGRLFENSQRRANVMHGYRVVIGGEPGFPGFDTIERNFKLALGNQFPIYPTLDETLEAAVALLQGGK